MFLRKILYFLVIDEFCEWQMPLVTLGETKVTNELFQFML